MASKTAQLEIRRKSFLDAVNSGDARNAKILLGNGFDWTESDHKIMGEAVGASLALNAKVFLHATEAYPELLLSAPPKHTAVATPYYTPPLPPAPTLVILSAFSDALRRAAEFGEDGAVSFSRPTRFEELAASASAVARWLSPLLAKNPDWAQQSIDALPGIFWHLLPAVDRELFFAQATPGASLSHGARVSAALGAMWHGMALNWPEAYRDGETQLKSAVAQMPKDIAKSMKARIGASLLRLGAGSGPVPDNLSTGVRWIATPGAAQPHWMAFHSRQAQTRPALIESALRFAGEFGALQWTKTPGGNKYGSSTPLSLAALTFNVTAWSFLADNPSTVAKDSDKSAALLSAAGNWSSIPEEAADIWARGGRANPNAAFDHSQAPWSDLSQQALFQTQLGALSQLYYSQRSRGALSNGFSAQRPLATVPDNGLPCARSAARLLFANNPLLQATACEELVLAVSQRRGFDHADHPNLLAEWLLPAMAWEGASADFTEETLGKMGGKAQAQLSMIALQKEIEHAQPGVFQDAPRAPSRSANRL